MDGEAQQIIGAILAAGAFFLMVAIIWFAWDDSRRIG